MGFSGDMLLRPARASDLSFIHSSWKKSLRPYSDLGNAAYYALANSECSSILGADPIVLVAHDPETPTVIRGWVCVEAMPSALVLWMGYSKSWSRREGVFTSLLNAATALAEEEGAGEARLFAFETRFDGHLLAKGWKRTSVAKALHLRTSRVELLGSGEHVTLVHELQP